MTETVNLLNLKKGDTVHFRCGGSAVVESVYLYEHAFKFNVSITFKKYESNENSLCVDYCHDGGFHLYQTPFDIIRVEPAEFDWSTVKAGMGFKSKEGGIAGYIIGFEKNGYPVIRTKNFMVTYLTVEKSDLDRAPEYDVEIKTP